MALDLYTWLAQRLHRINPKRGGAFVPWVSLKEQFGPGYGRMDNFKRVFRTTLKQVAVIYREAKFDVTDKGHGAVHQPAASPEARVTTTRPVRSQTTLLTSS